MNCPDCVNAYDGADGELRCRVNGLKCTPANSDDCKRFEREAGADGVESQAHRVWYCDCVGRGD